MAEVLNRLIQTDSKLDKLASNIDQLNANTQEIVKQGQGVLNSGDKMVNKEVPRVSVSSDKAVPCQASADDTESARELEFLYNIYQSKCEAYKAKTEGIVDNGIMRIEILDQSMAGVLYDIPKHLMIISEVY